MFTIKNHMKNSHSYFKYKEICKENIEKLRLNLQHDLKISNNTVDYYLYQAIWRSNKSVYLIFSGKSIRMRTIL